MGNLLRASDAALAAQGIKGVTYMTKLLDISEASATVRELALPSDLSMGGVWVDAVFTEPCNGFHLWLGGYGSIDSQGIVVNNGNGKYQHNETANGGATWRWDRATLTRFRLWLLPYNHGNRGSWLGQLHVSYFGPYDTAAQPRFYFLRVRMAGGNLKIQPATSGQHSITARGIVRP